jgi:hypothetical protein
MNTAMTLDKFLAADPSVHGPYDVPMPPDQGTAMRFVLLLPAEPHMTQEDVKAAGRGEDHDSLHFIVNQVGEDSYKVIIWTSWLGWLSGTGPEDPRARAIIGYIGLPVVPPSTN